jgi:hypothetical protein
MTVTASFYDQAGHSTTNSLDVTLECVESSEATSDTCEEVCGAASTTCAGMVFYWNGGSGTSGIPCTDFKEYVPTSDTNLCILPMSDVIDNPTPSGVSGGCICEL